MNARAFSEREAGPVTHERACAGCGAMGEHTGDSCEPCELAYAAACYHALRCGCASCVIYDRMRASRGAPACAPAIAAALATPDHDRGVMLPPAPASTSVEVTFHVRLRLDAPDLMRALSALTMSAAALAGAARLYGLGDTAVALAVAVTQGLKTASVKR